MKKIKEYIKVKDSFYSNENFTLFLNESNEVLYTSPKPSERKLSEYYSSSQYLSHKNSGSTIFSKIYFISRSCMVFLKKELISGLCPQPGRIVDVGSGTGDFLSAQKKIGWITLGIEPSLKAREIAEKLNVSHVSSLKELEERTQDVITFWHSLEHVYDLDETLNQAKRVLKNKGYLIVACPNYTSWDAKYYRKNWAAWDVPRHLRHFSPNSLNLILNKEGFSQVQKKPLFLDAFYVSILSEKIQKNTFGFLKGILIGLVSNMIGFVSTNYSSHIYVFEKKSK